jgi:hypothetical protein
MKRSILHIETMAKTVLAFHHRRRRPITDEDSASVWREFDRLWSNPMRKPMCRQSWTLKQRSLQEPLAGFVTGASPHHRRRLGRLGRIFQIGTT